MKGQKSLVFVFVGLLLVASLFLSTSAKAAAPTPTAPIKLKYGTTEGPDHTFSLADKLWIDKIHKDTGGRVQITPYWGATLVSRTENVAELIKGVVDVAYLSPMTGYPIMLDTLAYPYGIPDWQTDARIYEEVFKKFPQIEAEWAALKIMQRSPAANYQLISRKPVRKIEDFKGLRVKATGVYTDVIKALGGEGFYLPMSETYIGLQKGTVDAALAPTNTLKAMKFYEVAKYVTVLDWQSAVRAERGMNLNSYNSLPKDIQKIFDDSIAFWSVETNKSKDKDDLEGIQLGKGAGVEFIKLSPEELAKLYKVMDTVMLASAAKLDAKGAPGTAIYKEVRRLVEQYIKK